MLFRYFFQEVKFFGKHKEWEMYHPTSSLLLLQSLNLLVHISVLPPYSCRGPPTLPWWLSPLPSSNIMQISPSLLFPQTCTAWCLSLSLTLFNLYIHFYPNNADIPTPISTPPPPYYPPNFHPTHSHAYHITLIAVRKLRSLEGFCLSG